MNKNSRSTNVIINAVSGLGGQLFSSLVAFVCRTFFVRLLGAVYLGVNGLFSNILSLLSLAELGIGPAIVFSMYKPIKDNDEEHVARLMNFYKKAYRIIAVVVAVLGLALIPALPYLIKDTSGIDNLTIIYVMILSNTVISYLFAYKGSMLTADQKNYVCVIFRNLFMVIQNVVQILVLVWTKNFLLYLGVQIITTFLANFLQAIYVDKKYPFLVKYKLSKIDKQEQKGIMRNVKGMMMHKVGGFVLNGTDNLIISKFIGIVTVGIYSNYLMIINLVKTLVTQSTGSASASVGNLIASESKEKTYTVFNSLFFVYAWIYVFCFVCFWVIFQPFITLWLGGEYLLDKLTLFIVLINLLFVGFQECINSFTNATGLFWETKNKPIFECIINIVVSVVLAYFIGLPGVFIGTAVSFLCTFWINPIVVFKKQFGRSPLPYFLRFLLYFVIALLLAFGTEWICNLIVPNATLFQVILRILISLVLPNIIWIALFFKTEAFRYCMGLIKGLLSKFKRKKINAKESNSQGVENENTLDS